MNERRRRLLVETALLVLTAVLIAVVLRASVAQAFRIPSSSMEPQLQVGDRVVVSRISYEVHDPRRGDIVVFDCPPGAGCPRDDGGNALGRAVDTVLEALLVRQPRVEEFIKRVIALPGETVQCKEGSVWIDGRRLLEPYLGDGVTTGDFAPVTIAPGDVWVMGDNRGNSSDSRVFGPVDADTIVGRAVFRVWPPQRTAFL